MDQQQVLRGGLARLEDAPAPEGALAGEGAVHQRILSHGEAVGIPQLHEVAGGVGGVHEANPVPGCGLRVPGSWAAGVPVEEKGLASFDPGRGTRDPGGEISR